MPCLKPAVFAAVASSSFLSEHVSPDIDWEIHAPEKKTLARLKILAGLEPLLGGPVEVY